MCASIWTLSWALNLSVLPVCPGQVIQDTCMARDYPEADAGSHLNVGSCWQVTSVEISISMCLSHSIHSEYIVYCFIIVSGTSLNIIVDNCWLQAYQNAICLCMLKLLQRLCWTCLFILIICRVFSVTYVGSCVICRLWEQARVCKHFHVYRAIWFSQSKYYYPHLRNEKTDRKILSDWP